MCAVKSTTLKWTRKTATGGGIGRIWINKKNKSTTKADTEENQQPNKLTKCDRQLAFNEFLTSVNLLLSLSTARNETRDPDLLKSTLAH